jgi:ABC-type nitrate/sulfonate/bicarbonate transport system permease component
MSAAQFGVYAGRALSRLGPFLIVSTLWETAVQLHVADPEFLPGLGAIGTALIDLIRTGSVFHDLGTTLLTAMAGLALGILVGVPLGTAMALSPTVDSFFGPLIKATYSLPKSALIPLFVLLFGIGGLTNILATVLTTLLPIVIYTYHGVHGVPRVFVWSARSMGTPDWKLLPRILLPSASPSILTGIRIALGFAFIVTIAAEMIVSNYGIGKQIFLFGSSGSYTYMFAAVLLIMLAAFVADRILVRVSDHLLRWLDPLDRDD